MTENELILAGPDLLTSHWARQLVTTEPNSQTVVAFYSFDPF